MPYLLAFPERTQRYHRQVKIVETPSPRHQDYLAHHGLVKPFDGCQYQGDDIHQDDAKKYLGKWIEGCIGLCLAFGGDLERRLVRVNDYRDDRRNQEHCLHTLVYFRKERLARLGIEKVHDQENGQHVGQNVRNDLPP